MDKEDTNYIGEHKCNSFPFSLQNRNTDCYDFYDDDADKDFC